MGALKQARSACANSMRFHRPEKETKPFFTHFPRVKFIWGLDKESILRFLTHPTALLLILSCFILELSICRCEMQALASDCNINNQLDDLDIQTGSSVDCNENGIPDECEIESIQFTVRPGYPVNRSTQFVVMGDFNGDGLVDMASGNSPSGGASISVLLNQGTNMRFSYLI